MITNLSGKILHKCYLSFLSKELKKSKKDESLIPFNVNYRKYDCIICWNWNFYDNKIEKVYMHYIQDNSLFSRLGVLSNLRKK